MMSSRAIVSGAVDLGAINEDGTVSGSFKEQLIKQQSVHNVDGDELFIRDLKVRAKGNNNRTKSTDAMAVLEISPPIKRMEWGRWNLQLKIIVTDIDYTKADSSNFNAKYSYQNSASETNGFGRSAD